MAVRNCWDELTMLPCTRRERYRTLSHRWLPVARAVMRKWYCSGLPTLWSILLSHGDLMDDAGTSAVERTFGLMFRFGA
jgi:hypothetical protein